MKVSGKKMDASSAGFMSTPLGRASREAIDGAVQFNIAIDPASGTQLGTLDKLIGMIVVKRSNRNTPCGDGVRREAGT